MNYYTVSAESVIKGLTSDAEKGLSIAQYEDKRAHFGKNELEAKKKINPFVLFLNQFKSFIIYILLFAVFISVIAHEVVDAIVILLILLFNAFFGFIQEYKAEKAIDALKKLSGYTARVIRNGEQKEVDATELVPGDIILLEEGNRIPADCRIIESVNLQVEEASLTGESVPVSKHDGTLKGELSLADQKNMLFSGTALTRGKAKAIVTSTGMDTEIGKIAGMLNEQEDELTPLQKKLEALGKWIGIATIVICILVFVVGIFKEGLHTLLLSGQFVEFIFEGKEWFLVAISLAVAAVPEGLPAIVTIALAIGVKQMVKRNALIRKLPSVETLGESTVICSDKTGTLTKNQMTVTDVYTSGRAYKVSGSGYDCKGNITCDGKALKKEDALLFRIGALCNDASIVFKKNRNEIIGDPTEGALLVSAEKTGMKTASLKSVKRVKEEPFDSIRKLMSVALVDEKKSVVYTKGAPEAVLDKCTKILVNGKVQTLTAQKKKELRRINEEYATQALRVLGFAYKPYKKGEKLEKDLIFVGLQGMIDPPHEEVKGAIARCTEAGIRVIMITGDNRHTAQGIAKQIGIVGKAINGADFAKLTEKQQITVLKEAAVFARVEPKHKMMIVDLLRKQGEIVTMTGDGVNDAPAIKKADLGVAMGITGTDVTKEASDMVVLDDNFTSIVNAIEEGRGIYVNIRKFVNYLLSCNLGEIFIIFFAIVFGWHLPMTAIMLLWLNLVTDGLPALALSVDPNPKDLMKQKPKSHKEGIMNRSMTFQITYVSILVAIATLWLFSWAMEQYAYLDTDTFIMKTQTVAFTAVIVMEIVRLQAIRSQYRLGLFSNWWLVIAVLVSFGLQLLVIYTPLAQFFGTVPLVMIDWILIIAATFVVLVFTMIGTVVKNHIPYFRD